MFCWSKLFVLWETTVERRFNGQTSGHVKDLRKILAVTLSSLLWPPLIFLLNVLAWDREVGVSAEYVDMYAC